MHRTRVTVVRPQGGLQSDINVTPLVDVVLVLLIIFMVVTPLVIRNIPFQVPEVEKDTKVEPVTELPPSVVGITAEGGFTLDGEPVVDADYVSRLRHWREGRPESQQHLFFQADDRADYARLVAALDGAKAAGITVFGVLTE